MRAAPRFSLCLLLVLLWCLPARAAGDPWKAKPRCVFGMPYIGRAVQPDQAGIVINVLRLVFEGQGVEARHEVMPYERAADEVGKGTIQCTLDVGNRHPKSLPTERPLLNYDLAAARLAATPWKGVESLRGTRVAYLQGFDLGELVPVPFTPQPVFDLASAFPMLEDKFVAFILDDVRLLDRALRDSRIPSHLFAVEPITSLPVRLIFAPTDEGRRYRDIYDRRMRELAASGELARVLLESGLSQERVDRLLKAR
ncbi:MAG: hypothetical protein V3571_09670 [Pseudodesulfovibrio sp.]